MRALKRKAAAVLVAGGLCAAALAPAADAAPTSLQSQIDKHIARYGGVQVSDNAIAWKDGPILVFPDTAKGEKNAPAGLGRHVREKQATAAGISDASKLESSKLAESTNRSVSPQVAATVHGCPGGVTVTDYYCFYVDRDFGGRRLQFASTVNGKANNYGFDNQTSSWVNNSGVDYPVDAFNSDAFSGYLWRMAIGSSSSYVGSGNDNRMSSWAKVF